MNAKTERRVLTHRETWEELSVLLARPVDDVSKLTRVENDALLRVLAALLREMRERADSGVGGVS